MTSTDEDISARDRLLEAALVHVPFDGWSTAALRMGARDIDVAEDDVSALFPGGARDAIVHFSRWADRRMVSALEAADLDELRVHERVALAVRTRLDLLAPHREAVRRGLSWLALPQNAGLGMRLVYHTVDDIWYAAGDRSADFSFYTKRALLAGVLGSTTLFWLDDDSEEGAASHAFLDRRLGDVMRFHRARGRAESIGGSAAMPLRALRDALRNRYGMGDSRVT